MLLGADVNHVDNKGRNALSLAKEKGFDDIAHFLKNHGKETLRKIYGIDFHVDICGCLA